MGSRSSTRSLQPQDTANDVFVGSSSEFLKLPWDPRGVVRTTVGGHSLPDGSRLNVNVWTDWFEDHPTMEIFRSLDLAAKTSEWAIFVFRADDLRRRLRAKSIGVATVRDNVLFELGLFFGYLGTQRVFILEEEKNSHKVKVAGDIDGIQRYRFSDHRSFERVLKKVCKKIEERSQIPFLRWVPAASLAIGYCSQGLRPFVEQRRSIGRQRPGATSRFKVEVLVPTKSFAGLAFSDVRARFEGAGYRQLTPGGSSKGRPAMWVRRSSKTPKPAVETYYDIPTTLFTIQKVISGYLGDTATPREVEQLVASQARDFVREVRGERVAEVVVRDTFRTIEDITDYLESRPG